VIAAGTCATAVNEPSARANDSKTFMQRII
jgi:hypothetical protein